MRYKEGTVPDPQNPYTEGMHATLMVSVILALLIGVVLLAIGWKGGKLWMICWSAGLILCSVAYIILRVLGYT